MICNPCFRLLGFISLLLVSNMGHSFERLVIFGDSLSDTGNTTNGFNLPPPYFNNRISNGFLAVDILASKYGLSAASAEQFSGGNGDNYAVSGGNAAGSSPQDLSAQIAAFRSRNPQGVTNNTLILLMIGGNDLRDAKNVNSATSRALAITNAVDGIANAITSLGQLGAEHILVSNAPDISRIPETLEQAAINPSVIIRAREVTILFNSMLVDRLSQLKTAFPGKIERFDLHTELKLILDQPGSFGFSVADRACFDPSRFRFNPGCDFEQFVFFDSIHPTAKTHGVIGLALYNASRKLKSGKDIGGALFLLLE